MSEIKLNLVDVHTILAGTIHGSVGDACIAALTAEPETIAELEAALTRYIKPDERFSPFASFGPQSAIDAQPHDAGLVIIHLAARLVAVESTYSQPGPEGVVNYHNGKYETDIPIRYTVDPEWLFVNSVESYRWSVERRRAERLARPRIDTRAILYGRPMLQHIVDFQTGVSEKGFSLPPQTSESADVIGGEIVKAHAAWLTTPRDDLGGRAPREVMLEKRDLIELDLDSRGWQWSMQGEGPPCLPLDSHAYRYGGFGTHEWVVYYDLVRHLFCMATLGGSNSNNSRTGSDSDLVSSLVADTRDGIRTGSGSDRVTGLTGDPVTSLISDLERYASFWLESPHSEYDGRTPAVIIDNERRRLPITMTPEQLMLDDDCECCQMLARDAANGAPTFWHLDGCNMENEFAFSTCLTIQEWEAEQRRYEEWGLESARRDAERREMNRRQFDPDGELEPDSWQPLELESHEMAELLEQMKITPSIHFNAVTEEDEETPSQREPVN